MSIPLNTYIGAIVSQLTESRAAADLTTVSIAKTYEKDELLKNFSVPRFRASDVEVTIPVAIDTIEENVSREYDPIDNKEFNSRTYQSLKEVSRKESFNRELSITLKKLIANQSSVLEKDLKLGLNKDEVLKKYSNNLSEHFIKITDNQDEKYKEQVVSKLTSDLTAHIITSRESVNIGATRVIVEADRLREIDPSKMIQIKIKLNEDGMEWHTDFDENGKEKSKLLPE